jgi:hypothetical protein
LSPKLVILRLTTRGLLRGRRRGRGRAKISRVPCARAAARRSGGKARLRADLPAREAQRAGERQAVGIEALLVGRGVH